MYLVASVRLFIYPSVVCLLVSALTAEPLSVRGIGLYVCIHGAYAENIADAVDQVLILLFSYRHSIKIPAGYSYTPCRAPGHVWSIRE